MVEKRRVGGTSAKWSALARYAQDHTESVRRCMAVAVVAGSLKALDLTTPDIDHRIAEATNQNLIAAIFDGEGMSYP
ncbi:hypothetical protein [Gordonia alkanivorans]|uniref:hypothetical protein n=1 Tax=Gordonia alkanivorans TaxID=84096 RepID=UPI002448E796|nr:hypothetical protein [Gordonia alkanivorans]MDH3013845.1 hypothetical protein [Gordonia alkanivorans]